MLPPALPLFSLVTGDTNTWLLTGGPPALPSAALQGRYAQPGELPVAVWDKRTFIEVLYRQSPAARQRCAAALPRALQLAALGEVGHVPGSQVPTPEMCLRLFRDQRSPRVSRDQVAALVRSCGEPALQGPARMLPARPSSRPSALTFILGSRRSEEEAIPATGSLQTSRWASGAQSSSLSRRARSSAGSRGGGCREEAAGAGVPGFSSSGSSARRRAASWAGASWPAGHAGRVGSATP